jgi:E3 ubiquitin-protein ligase HUWE1
MNDNFLTDIQNMHQNMRSILGQLNSSRQMINSIRISTRRAPGLTTEIITADNPDMESRQRNNDTMNINDLENRYVELQNIWRNPTSSSMNIENEELDSFIVSEDENSRNQGNDSDSPSMEFGSIERSNENPGRNGRGGMNSVRQRQNRMFNIDFHTHRRLNPLGESSLELGYSSSFRNGLFGQPNIFQEDLQDSDSESGLILAEDEHFDMLEHDDYSSGTDINEDPIGVNMDGLRMPVDEEEEVINVMEMNNEFQDERFGDFLEQNPENQGNVTRNMLTGDMRNSDPPLEEFVLRNNERVIDQEIRDLENILINQRRYMPVNGIREEEEIIEEELDQDNDNYHFSETSESFFPEFTNNFGNNSDNSDFEEQEPQSNLRQISNTSREWEDPCSCDEVHPHHHSSSDPDPEQMISKEGSKDIQCETSQKVYSSKSLNEASPHDEDVIRERLEIANLPILSKKISFLSSLLSPLTQPFLSHESNQEFLVNQEKKYKSKKKNKVSKNLLTFKTNADIWGEKYFDLLAFYCMPKYKQYPFRFPRKLFFDLTKINCDFGSKYIAMMLSNTDYTLRTTVWTNLPIVHRPATKGKNKIKEEHLDSSNNRESRRLNGSMHSSKPGDILVSSKDKMCGAMVNPVQNILFSDIRLVSMALKKENLFWKKNLEEFNSVNFKEWGLSYSKRLMELDSLESLGKKLLSKTKDFYNYPRNNQNGRKSEMSNLDFLKHLYWTNNNSKQSVLEKITILEHNMFTVSSFDNIKSLSTLVRDSIPAYQQGMVTIEPEKKPKSKKKEEPEPEEEVVVKVPLCSVFECLKKNLKSRESSLSKKIEFQDMGYNYLKKKVSQRREVTLESEYFNTILLNELNKYNAKSRKSEAEKKKSQKKREKLIEFAKKHISYFDLSVLDLENKHSFLISDKKEDDKSKSIEKKQNLNQQMRLNKEFTLSGAEVNQSSNPRTPNPPVVLTDNNQDAALVDVQSGNAQRNTQQDEIQSLDVWLGINEENVPDQNNVNNNGDVNDTGNENVNNNSTGGNDVNQENVNEGEEGDERRITEEAVNQPVLERQVDVQGDGPVFINETVRLDINVNLSFNHTNNTGQLTADNINIDINRQNEDANNQEPEIPVNDPVEQNENQNTHPVENNINNNVNTNEAEPNNQENAVPANPQQEEINNLLQEVEQNMALEQPPRFNFTDLGLPENFLEIAGIPEEVFNTYTPDIQNEIINIYATDLNLYDNPIIPPVTRTENPEPNPIPARVPGNTNPNPTPNPEIIPTPSNNDPNTVIPSPAPQENRPNPETLQENEQRPGDVNPNAPDTVPIVEEQNEGPPNTTPVEPLIQEVNANVTAPAPALEPINERHFLFDLDQTLRNNVLAEMPQDQIDLLPLELRNQANQVRAERGILNVAQVNAVNTNQVNQGGGIRRPDIINMPGRFGFGNARAQENMLSRNGGNTRVNDEYQLIEMQYNGIDKIKKCLKDSSEMIGKFAKNNREKNFFNKMYKENKMQNLRSCSPEMFDLIMNCVGFMGNNTALRVGFPYLIGRKTEHKYNQSMITKMGDILKYLKSKPVNQGRDKVIVINPREKSFLKNLLMFMTDTIKTHNSYFTIEKDHVRGLFELFKEVVKINEEVIKFRFLLLLTNAVRFRVEDKQADKSMPEFVVNLKLDFDIRIDEIETLLSLLLYPHQLHGKKEFLAHMFFMIDILMLNPKNTPVLIDGISEFVNRFCEKINIQFTQIKKLTFEKTIKIKENVNKEEKKKKKVRLITKSLGVKEKGELKEKIGHLKVHILYLLKIFEKVEVIFIKMINQVSEKQSLFEYLEKEMVEHSLDFLRKKEAANEAVEFVKFKKTIHQFQQRFYEEKMQDVYLKFAKMLRKRNLKSMFKNMFLILRVFEENFEEMVKNRPQLSFPLFYRLEPLLETFLIFYKMISNCEIQDYFKQELTKKVVGHKKEMKKLYRYYHDRFVRVKNKQEIQDLIQKLEQSQTADLIDKNESLKEEKDSSIECSMDLGVFQPKKKEIKASEYKPRFNQPDREKRSSSDRDNQLRMSQRHDARNRSQNESIITEYSLDKQDLSYLMAKNESTVYANDSRIIKTQIFNDIRKEFDKLFRTGVNMNKKVINHIIRSKQKIWTSAFYVVVKTLPGLIKFENKRKFFRQFIQTISNRKVQRISVDRMNLFQTTFSELSSRSRDFFHNKWNISFNGEEGEDAGGVSREFYLSLSRAFLNPNYNYFRPASHGYAFHPSPTSHLTGNEPGVFKFIGRIVGKALFDGYYLDAHFTRAFYKQMIGHPVTYEDFEDYDPQYFKNLKWVINNDPEALAMTFTVEHTEFGVTREEELKPGGSNIYVTQENKNEYVDLLVKHKLSDQAKNQVEEFLGGLYDVIPLNLLQIFDPKEIELLISGLPEININDLEKHTEYMGYTKDAQIIKWFWKILRSYDSNLKAGFLQFVTGTSKVPLEGFEYLKGMGGNIQRFQIHKSFNPQNLPTSHTCMNQLDLPQYKSEEELREKLTKAIEFGKEGFGFV